MKTYTVIFMYDDYIEHIASKLECHEAMSIAFGELAECLCVNGAELEDINFCKTNADTGYCIEFKQKNIPFIKCFYILEESNRYE